MLCSDSGLGPKSISEDGLETANDDTCLSCVGSLQTYTSRISDLCSKDIAATFKLYLLVHQFNWKFSA